MKNRKQPAVIQSTSDLAKQLNLSRWTISRVLNGHAGVAPETARRVQESMQKLGFSPNSLARGLRKGTTNIIGICIPEIEGFHLGQKLEFLRQALADEGWHAMVAMTNGERMEEGEALSRFRTLHAAGVILFASQLTPRCTPVRQFHETGIPLIFVDPMTPPPKGSLCVDRSVGMREATLHLLELGHRHIATLGLTGESRYTRSRRKGVAEAYEERGLNPARFVREIALPESTDSFYARGRASAALVWNNPVRPTALLAVNDRVAIGLLDGLRELRVRVPEDLSVIGYDNMEMTAFLSPQLTTIDTKPDDLISKATERLLQSVHANGESERASILIPSRLLLRASTARARD
ncbi:MAG: LacI family DNA-binding transcriptional regulator [Verrucomicrobiota bacterium]